VKKVSKKQEDFIGTKTLEEELKNLDEQVADMQSINLFGVSVTKALDDTKVISSQTQKLLHDLVTLTQNVDSLGVSADFRKRKSFMYYDPYNEDVNETNSTMLRYAADDDLERASIVVAQFQTQFEKINEEIRPNKSVGFIEHERMKQIELLLERLDSVKIIDAPVLLKLYDLYRYKPEE